MKLIRSENARIIQHIRILIYSIVNTCFGSGIVSTRVSVPTCHPKPFQLEQMNKHTHRTHRNKNQVNIIHA